MAFIKKVVWVTVRALRCAWVLAYSVFTIVALVQLHAVIVDPVALPHMASMTQEFFVSGFTFFKALV